MSHTIRWSLAMTALGLTAAGVAYLITASWGWALAALLGSGVIVNSTVSARAAHRSEGRRL